MRAPRVTLLSLSLPPVRRLRLIIFQHGAFSCSRFGVHTGGDASHRVTFVRDRVDLKRTGIVCDEASFKHNKPL